MAHDSTIKIHLEAVTAKYDAAMGRVSSSLDNLAKHSGVVGQAVGHALGELAVRGAEKFVEVLGSGLKAAGSLNEAVNKTDSIFGEASGTVKDFADHMADAFGKSKKETLDGAARIGAFAKDMGYTGQSAADFGVQMTTLAADMASFNDISFDRAITAVMGGLTGETEPLKGLGIVINETAVKQEAYTKGIAANGAELTDQQKLLARTSLIMRKTADQQGDLGKTSGSFNNQLAALSGRFENFSAAFASKVLPAFAPFVKVLNDVLAYLTQWVTAGADTIENWATSIGEYVTYAQDHFWEFVSAVQTYLAPLTAAISDFTNSAIFEFKQMYSSIGFAEWAKTLGGWGQWLLDGLTEVFKTLAVVIRNWGAIWERTTVLIGGWASNIVEYALWLRSAFAAFLDWFGTNWRTIFADAFNATLVALKNLGENFMSFGKSAYDWIASGFSKPFEFQAKPVLDGFSATTPALKTPELQLSNVDKQLADIDNRMLQKEMDHTDSVFGKTPEKDEEKLTEKQKAVAKVGERGMTAQDALTKDKKDKEAQKFDLVDFGSKLLLSGTKDKDGIAKDALNESKKQTASLQNIEKKLPIGMGISATRSG